MVRCRIGRAHVAGPPQVITGRATTLARFVVNHWSSPATSTTLLVSQLTGAPTLLLQVAHRHGEPTRPRLRPLNHCLMPCVDP
jgi:hypothetical protein